MRIKIPNFIGRKMKRYIVYIEIPDEHAHVKCGYRAFKFTAWLLARKAKKTWNDDVIIIIYDRKKGDLVYEK